MNFLTQNIMFAEIARDEKVIINHKNLTFINKYLVLYFVLK